MIPTFVFNGVVACVAHLNGISLMNKFVQFRIEEHFICSTYDNKAKQM
jgi:hypothetical protein